MVKKFKELMEKDALNRILWDRNLKPEKYSIVYLDRGQLKEVSFLDVKLDGDFFWLGDGLIPMHRIRKILEGGEVVWERRRI